MSFPLVANQNVKLAVEAWIKTKRIQNKKGVYRRGKFSTTN